MLYHGTRRPFRKGGLLLPRAKHGAEATSAPLMPGAEEVPEAAQYVYVTTSEVLAWVYAWHAPGRGRPRVLTVKPIGQILPDPEHSPEMEAYRCDAASVTGVSLTPLVTEQEARGGWLTATR